MENKTVEVKAKEEKGLKNWIRKHKHKVVGGAAMISGLILLEIARGGKPDEELENIEETGHSETETIAE